MANKPIRAINQGGGEDAHNTIMLPDNLSDWIETEIRIDQIYDQIRDAANSQGLWLNPLQTATHINLAGMAASVFKNPNTGEVVISYRGTQVAEAAERPADFQADAALGSGATPDQVYAAYFFYKAVVASGVDPVKITMTGHSLGSGLIN